MYYSLPIINPKTRSTNANDTFHFSARDKWPVGTVALEHGHIDGTSLGMADDWNPVQKLHGDVDSLLGNNPLPMATVSEGRLGWHQLENGRLQFVAPAGRLSPKDAEVIQQNLDVQQLLFQRRHQ